MRQKQYYRPDLCLHRWTTADCLFSQNVFGRWESFQGKGFVWDDDDLLIRYILGEYPRIGKSWMEVERIYIPINVFENHWILGEVDLPSWSIFIYDSMRGSGARDKEIFNLILPFARIIADLLTKFNYLDNHPEIKWLECTELLITQADNVPQQDNM